MSDLSAENVAELAAATVHADSPHLARVFEGVAREGAYRVTPEGELPDWLVGSYYVNGPGRFARGEVRYGHWLDGDGLVQALHFDPPGAVGDDARVEFVQRYVGSEKRRDEEAAGRALYRTFGTRFAGDALVRGIALASPVNVSIYPFADRLLAFGEQGLPWRLDPRTLETLEPETFGRRLNPISPFAAHPGFDPATGEMLNFGLSFSASQPLLHLYRFTAAGELVYRRRFPVPHPASVHDFALSPTWAVFYLSPYLLDMDALGRDGATVMEALEWRPELGSRLLVIARQTGELVADLAIGGRYCLHLVGCFEDEAGRLVVDVIELDRPVYDQYTVPDIFPDVRQSEPVRYVVDVGAGRVGERTTLAFRSMCDFPATDPRRWESDYGDFWVLAISQTELPGPKLFDRLVHLDWHRGGVVAHWQAPRGSYLGGEPVFAPHPGDAGAGAIVCQLLDAERRRGAYLVFDAHDVGRGPVARLPLRDPVHLGFHAAFAPRGATRP